MSDLHIRHVIILALKTIRSNPEKHLKDIFGEATLQPHAAIYGQRSIQQMVDWIKKTEVPVILGFDLTEAKMPAITVHLSASSPDMPYIGDEGIGESEDLGYQDKEVLVPAFQPAGIDNTDPTSWKLTLPADMPFELQELFLPGLKLRDAVNREYLIGRDSDGNVRIMESDPQAPLEQMDYSRLEVVSPVIQARYSRGQMQYNETVTIVVHGMSARQEGLWLFYVTMWALLRFRPLLTSVFGLDLSTPSASDYAKDDQFLGENVWRRYITVNAKTSWTWEMHRQQDLLGYLTSFQAQSGSGEGPVPLS